MASVYRSSSSDLDPNTLMPFTWHKRVVITASAVFTWLPLLNLVVWRGKEKSIIGRLDLDQLLSRRYSYPADATGRRHRIVSLEHCLRFIQSLQSNYAIVMRKKIISITGNTWRLFGLNYIYHSNIIFFSVIWTVFTLTPSGKSEWCYGDYP